MATTNQTATEKTSQGRVRAHLGKTVGEKRKLRQKSRILARRKEKERFKDISQRKAHTDARGTRSAARIASFSKAKSAK